MRVTFEGTDVVIGSLGSTELRMSFWVDGNGILGRDTLGVDL